jgi:hypothetical protein
VTSLSAGITRGRNASVVSDRRDARVWGAKPVPLVAKRKRWVSSRVHFRDAPRRGRHIPGPGGLGRPGFRARSPSGSPARCRHVPCRAPTDRRAHRPRTGVAHAGEVGVGATDDPLSVYPPAGAVPDNIGIEQFGECPVVARRCEPNEPTRQGLVLDGFDQAERARARSARARSGDRRRRRAGPRRWKRKPKRFTSTDRAPSTPPAAHPVRIAQPGTAPAAPTGSATRSPRPPAARSRAS